MESPRSSNFGGRNISLIFRKSTQRLFETINGRTASQFPPPPVDPWDTVEWMRKNEIKEGDDFATVIHYDNYMLRSARLGDQELVEHFLKKGVIHKDMSDHMDRTAVHLAILSGNTEVLKLLLKAGFDVNSRDGFGRTPLYYSAIQRPNLKAAKMLFSYGASIQPRMNPTDLGLFLTLVSMAKPTKTEESLIKLFLQHGALLEDENAPGKRQGLHYAAMANNTRMIHFLLDPGADQSSRNACRMTPLDIAVFFGCKDAVYYLENMGIQTLLLSSNDSQLHSNDSSQSWYCPKADQTSI